jgi:hypothetical protein
MKRNAACLSIMTHALGLSICGAPPAEAQQIAPVIAPDAPARKPPTIEPKAIELLKAMGQRIAGASSLSFTVRRAFDEISGNGQPLLYMVATDVTLKRPNGLRVITTGDGPREEFYYNGQTMTVYLPGSKLVAVSEAPAKVDDMLEAAYAKAGIYFPFVDFIVDDPYAALTEKLTSAFVMGKSKVVAGVETDIVVITNDAIQAQIWIGAKDRLPRLAWITPLKGQQKPRNVVEFTNWKLGAATTAKTFRSEEAAKAGRMNFGRVAAGGAPKP